MIAPLQTWRWALSDDAAELRAAISPNAPVAVLTRLRDRWSPDQIAVVSELASARAKAARKFPDRAPTLAADREGVEMASSTAAGAHKAARFHAVLGPGTPILDACCGIGGDTMALARAGLAVTALDLDERRAWMGGHNASCPWIACDARSAPAGFRAVHIDPARRNRDGRTHTTEAFEPPLSDMLATIESVDAGAIKLHPGVRATDLPDGELEIISERGTLTQGVLWTGSAARAQRTATLLGPEGQSHTLSGPPDRPDDANPVDSFVHTMDPALERADLVGTLLRQVPLLLVHPGTGLLTGTGPVRSPWLTPYRVLHASTWNAKSVRARLRGLDAGVVTVKARGGVVDPDRVARQLRGDGAKELVVFILPIGERAHAIIAERTRYETPPDGTSQTGGVRAEPAG